MPKIVRITLDDGSPHALESFLRDPTEDGTIILLGRHGPSDVAGYAIPSKKRDAWVPLLDPDGYLYRSLTRTGCTGDNALLGAIRKIGTALGFHYP